MLHVFVSAGAHLGSTSYLTFFLLLNRRFHCRTKVNSLTLFAQFCAFPTNALQHRENYSHLAGTI